MIDDIDRTLHSIEVDPLSAHVLLACAGTVVVNRVESNMAEERGTDSAAAAVLRHLQLSGARLGLDDGSQHDRFLKVALAAAHARIDAEVLSGSALASYLALRRTGVVDLLERRVTRSYDAASATWRDIRTEPALSRAFDEHMVGRSTRHLSVQPRPAAARTIVDVGGGPGHYAAQLLMDRTAGWHRALVLDNYSEAGWIAKGIPEIAHRVDVRMGDLHSSIPAGAGMYLLASILHNLDDEGASRVLALCSAAASAESQVVIVERTWNPSILADSSRDLDMRLLFGGRERADAEIAALIDNVGLRCEAMFSTPDSYRVVIADRRI